MTDASQRPFAHTSIAKFLDERVEQLKPTKSQRQIAIDTGYDKPNMISMFKRGDTKVPLDKIPALAAALETDAAHLFRLALEQYWPDLDATIQKMIGHVATETEFKLLLEPWRHATDNMDPTPDALLARQIATLIDEFGRSLRRRVD